MEFKNLSDADIVDNYQHEFVVDQYRGDIEKKKVLDAGCWTGPLEKVIIDKGISTKLLGIDMNKAALKVAKKNFPKFSFKYCVLDSKNDTFIKEYSKYFDSIIFLDVIEHLPKNTESDSLRLFYKLLKDDGSLIVSTMASHPLDAIDPAWIFGHRHYRLRKLRKIFNDAGFEIYDVYKCGNLYWDLDLLYFYIYKHIFRKKYHTSDKMLKKICKGLSVQKMPTRYYIKAKKI